MKKYTEMTPAERQKELTELEKKLGEYKDMDMNLNLSRGNPSVTQLNRVTKLFSQITSDNYISEEGLDCRNYGGLLGLIEVRRSFADLLNTSYERIWVLGSSSLTIEHDLIMRSLVFPLPGVSEPWKAQKTKFICPVPGYDRHFTILDLLGIDLIAVPLLADGPDMTVVEELCANDDNIKGMWAVPMYSNPDGTTYSEDCLKRLFTMKAAKDFRIFADMAYCAHHFDPEDAPEIPDLLSMAKACGNPDRVFVFASTSKITYAGAGVAVVGMSDANQEWLAPSLSAQMISADKMNQLRHFEAIKQAGGIKKIADLHRPELREKFSATLNLLNEMLADSGIAEWKTPKGGYFIAVKLLPGTAKATVSRCREMGLILTAAGSVFPHGFDPEDSYLRLAPTYPDLDSLLKAMRIFCLVARYEAMVKLQKI